ncbi:MAG: hypothetical protein EBV20_08610 [Betaproteobacteria bacterium]|jgi:hypothetical protein|nr:hypothetical protein [Betaproteobacteria bacterium]
MSGAVAIWHSLAPEGLAEFYAWHGEEHMPERVSIPGFRCGRRFIAQTGELAFFNLYETESPDVVKGADYKARLDHPTPRTLSAVRHFREVARSLCRVVVKQTNAQAGLAQAGLVATLRYDVEEALEAQHLAILQEQVVPAICQSAGICAVSLLLADRVASGYVNAEQRARNAANLVPPLALIVESWAEPESFRTVLNAHLSPSALKKHALSGITQLEMYTHQLTVTR